VGIALMKTISKILAICLSLVFSLAISGPAFSVSLCNSQSSQMSGQTMPSSNGVHDHNKMVLKKCCQRADCGSFSSATVQTRFYEVEPLALTHIAWHIDVLEDAFAKASTPFYCFKVRQRPPLLLDSSYKAHLARTTRQNI